MLSQTQMTTILPVADLERARKFYGDALGLTAKGQTGDGKPLFACANGMIALMPRSPATPAVHTAASFEVSDIAKMIASLSDRGVHFEDYDLPGLKTVDHVCVIGAEKAAWFRDPDGNILCLHETLSR